jgi:hypothetical protein
MSAFARGPWSRGRPMSRRSHVSVFMPPWPVWHADGKGLVRALARQARSRAGRPMGRMILRRGRAMVALAVEALVTGTALAHAQAPVTVSGLPQQVIATFPEVGAPTFTTSPGTPSTGDTGAQGTGDTGGSGTGSTGGSSDALNTMLGQPWGSAAINNAQALGVNPSVLAGTCAVESGCQNVGASGSSSATGAFQMMPATYNAMIAAATQQDPSLAANIVPGAAGMMDPATESIAASEYLYQGAQALQSNGISNPTGLDVRGYYNFGPLNGGLLANAPDSQTMASAMPGVSAATLAANGVTSGETVGQWRVGVTSKIGGAASAPVLR